MWPTSTFFQMTTSRPRLQGVAFVLAILTTGGAAQAADPQPSTTSPAAALQVPLIATPIVVDGVLDEAAWTNALQIPLAYEWFPSNNGAAVVATTCYLAYDRDHLYLAFRAADPDPSQIRAHYADRDVPFLDDTVGFFLDPFNDERRAFQFRINPLGVQMDAVNSDIEGTEDWAWDAIWESAGKVYADHYVVEVALPFRQLRFPAGAAPQTWGFVAMRDFPRSLRHRMRSIATDLERGCFVCQLAKIRGFEQLETGHNLEITPTVTGRLVEELDAYPDGELESVDEELEPGLSARWGVTPNLSLNATLNPDFSQVEADAAQLDVNTQFALFFPEKRPFFLEGADFFETPLDLYFTRTVADPTGGLKLTGKAGANALAFSLVDDRLNNLLIPGSLGSDFVSLEQDVQSAALRWRRDLPGNANLGVLYTGREGDDYHNHLLGFDGLYRLAHGHNLRAQVVASRSRYPVELGFGDDELEGEAYFFNYNHSDANWFWRVQYDGRSPGFRADSGFIPQVGVHTGNIGIERTWRASQEKSWFQVITVFWGADAKREWHSAFNEWGSDLVFTYQGQRQSNLELVIAPNQEFFAGITYHNTRYAANFAFDPHRDIRVATEVVWGKRIDYANGRQADSLTLSPRVELNLGRHWRGELQHDRQELEFGGQRIFRLALTQGKLFYHFNRRAFLRAIVQYRDLARNPALHHEPVLERDQRLLTQLLFSYKLNAQTVFLLGYSDTHQGLDEPEQAPIELTQTSRTLFLKIGYAWLR